MEKDHVVPFAVKEILDLLDNKVQENFCALIVLDLFKSPFAFLNDDAVDLNLLLCVLRVVCDALPVRRNLFNQAILVPRDLLRHILEDRQEHVKQIQIGHSFLDQVLTNLASFLLPVVCDVFEQQI